MFVEMGNPDPTTDAESPAVMFVRVGDATYEVADSAKDLADEAASHIGRANGGVTHLPGQEALLDVIAVWKAESNAPKPSFVWSDNKDFEVLLGHFFDCPTGRPGDVEQKYWTHFGPPGVGPAPEPESPEVTE